MKLEVNWNSMPKEIFFKNKGGMGCLGGAISEASASWF